MFIADFETTTSKVSKTESNVWLWGIKGVMRGDKMSWGLKLEDFLRHIKKEKISPIYFHNTSFDCDFIFKWLLKNGHEFVRTLNNDIELGENQWTWLCNERGNVYKMTINFEGFEFEIFDSWKILMASVEDLGLSIGKKKLELDYDIYYNKIEDVPQKVIDYLERDIDVVIETLAIALSKYDKKMTRSAMAMHDFMENYGRRKFANDFGGRVWDYRAKQLVYKNILTHRQHRIGVKSYQGGYVNWNQNITNIKQTNLKGRSADVNSEYPAVMMNNKFPYGKVYNSKPRGTCVKLLVITIIKATKKNKNHPALIKKHGGKYKEAKYLDIVEHAEYVYWEEELEFLKKYYDIEYTVTETLWFKTKYIFDKWFNEKKYLKETAPNKLERDYHKGIFNGLGGKFGQNPTMGSRIIVRDDTPCEKWRKNQIRYGKNGEYIHKTVFETSDELKYIFVASYMTMKGRMTLFPAIMDNVDIWLYSDTDSCYYNGEPEGLDIDDNRFGAWANEYKFSEFKVLRAKCYMFTATHKWKDGEWKPLDKTVKKISGVSKIGKNQIYWNNFHTGSIIKNGKRAVQSVNNGKLIIDKDFTFGKVVKNV